MSLIIQALPFSSTANPSTQHICPALSPQNPSPTLNNEFSTHSLQFLQKSKSIEPLRNPHTSIYRKESVHAPEWRQSREAEKHSSDIYP